MAPKQSEHSQIPASDIQILLKLRVATYTRKPFTLTLYPVKIGRKGLLVVRVTNILSYSYFMDVQMQPQSTV